MSLVLILQLLYRFEIIQSKKCEGKTRKAASGDQKVPWTDCPECPQTPEPSDLTWLRPILLQRVQGGFWGGLPGCLCNAREGYLNAKKGAGSWLLLRALFVWILVFLTPQPGVQLPVDWPLKQWKNKQPWEPWALPGMGVSAEDSGGSSHWHREILSTVSLTKAHLELTDAWCDPLCWTGAADTVKKVVNSTFPSYPDPKLQWAHCRVIYWFLTY